MRDASGHLVAYEIPVDHRLAERLAGVWSHTGPAIWTALEFHGTAMHPTVAAVCAVRSDEAPGALSVPGLTVRNGTQGPLLRTLDPCSVERLDAPAVPLTPGLLDAVVWPTGSARPLGAHAR